MTDGRKGQDRPVLRVFQRHRLEEQLWSLAYQHLLPVTRQRAGAAQKPHRLYKTSSLHAQTTRRA